MKQIQEKGGLTISGVYNTLCGIMANEGSHTRPINLPRQVWAELDQDAKECRRSSLKQLEAILLDYYGLEDTSLRDTSKTRERISPHLAGRTGRQAAQFAFKRKVKNLDNDTPPTGPSSRKK